MVQRALIGRGHRAAALAERLVAAGGEIHWWAEPPDSEAVGGVPADGLVLAIVESEADLAAQSEAARRSGTPWVAWLVGEGAGLSASAYRAGAVVVLPEELTPDQVAQAFEGQVAARWNGRGSPPVRRRQQPRRGDPIALSADAALEVEEGVVALNVLHPDGAEVLLGLFGPGSLLAGHPEDGCFLQLVAHTAATVSMASWAEMARRPDFSDRVRLRLRQMEAWAAAQARPHLEQRVLGILALLAEEFGQEVEAGTRIGLRITHAQIASAVGATRTTVTRLLSTLRRRGVISMESGGEEGGHLCLRNWERADHGQACRHRPGSGSI